MNKRETNKIKNSKEQKDMLNILASNIDLTEKCVFMLLQAIILYTKVQLNLTKTNLDIYTGILIQNQMSPVNYKHLSYTVLDI